MVTVRKALDAIGCVKPKISCVKPTRDGVQESSALASGSLDHTVKIWDAKAVCNRHGDDRDGIDSTASLAEQTKAAVTAGKNDGKDGDWAGLLPSLGGDHPSRHGPVHAFGTGDAVYSVLFAKKNLVIASGV
ncbi:unnamed protein product [Pylaiella littoralis]